MRGVAGVQDLLGLTIAAVPLGGRSRYPACGTPRSADAQVLNFMLAGVLSGLQPRLANHSMSCCVVYFRL